MDKDGFIIYKSFYRPISRLSDEQLGRLFRAIFKYQLGEVVSEVVSEVVLKNDVLVDDDIKMAFEFFKNQFDIDECKYHSKVIKNQENASKGGAPKGNKNAIKDKTTEQLKNNRNNRTVEKQPYKDKDKDITSPTNVVEDNIPPKEAKASIPPTGEDEDWRTSFEVYHRQARAALDALIRSPDFISRQQMFHTDLDIPLSLEMSFDNFWGSEDGWQNKLKSKIKGINWQQTFANALKMESNQVVKKKQGFNIPL